MASVEGQNEKPSSNINANAADAKSASSEAPTNTALPRGRGSVWLRAVQRYIWDDPDKPKHEKIFLLKLDFFLLTWACYGYFCKNLDQSNINNAYVSGMMEAIKM